MRRLDWPERLADFLSQEYEYTDSLFCALWVGDVVLEMTGTDYVEEYRGLPKDAALERLRADMGGLRKKLAALFGEPIHPAFAQRGDVVVRNDERGTLGVCDGQYSAFLSDNGLPAREPTLSCLEAYRVR